MILCEKIMSRAVVIVLGSGAVAAVFAMAVVIKYAILELMK